MLSHEILKLKKKNQRAYLGRVRHVNELESYMLIFI